MATWKAFHNHRHLSAGVQLSFFEMTYEPGFTVDDMKAGDELIIVAPNGARSAGALIQVETERVVLHETGGDTWVLTRADDADALRAIIYPDMLNTIWTVLHRRPNVHG
jgi:hypothetical protein